MKSSTQPVHERSDNNISGSKLVESKESFEQTRDFSKLPKKALWQIRFKYFLSTFIVFTILIVSSFLFNSMIEDIFPIKLLVGGLIFLWLLMLGINFILSKLEYDYTAFHLGSDGLIIRKGMLWRSEIFVLRSRVQHIDVAQDPMSRLFGLATIKVYTAGTKLGSITLSGLKYDVAESIRNQLITQATDTL